MITDLSAALAAGDFGWWTNPLIWDHAGTARVRGEISPNTDTAQIILAAGGIPAPLRPSSALSVVLGASVADSSPYSHISPPVVPLSYAALDAVRASTIYPDGSWTLDAPLTVQYRELVILLTAEWDLAPVTDTPTGWASLAPLLTADWTNIDAEYATHGDTIHLRGSISIVSDLNTNFLNIAAGGLPERVLGDLSAEADTSGHAGPADLYVGDWDGSTSYLSLTTASRVPTSYQSSPYLVRVAGGTFLRSYPSPPTGYTDALRSNTAWSPDLTGTDWAADASYPHFSWDSPPSVQWRTPWWTWTTTAGTQGFAPGPVEAIPGIPSLDLAAAVGSFLWPPDWVTIQFHCDMTLAYTGYHTLADAQADTADPTDQVPESPFAHAQLSTARVAVTPYVSGVSNRQFVTSGTYGSSPGAFTGAPFNGSSASFDTYMALDSFAADCYLAPASPSFAPRGLIEPSGLEHAQLLWDPADVGTASVSIFGEAQAANLNVQWKVTPFWELPHDYLLAGDTITFTQRSWWPTAVAAVAQNFMMIL